MLTDRFADAFTFAEQLHRGQRRKGTEIPYVSHLMAVSALVLEHGGGEDEAIAALLHDAVEDQGGLATARVISDRFGPRVIKIVMACTDAVAGPGDVKPAWRARKSAFMERIPSMPVEAGRVVTCDKLHNLTSMLADLERDGPSTLLRFNHPAGLAWYYSGVARALEPFKPYAPVRRLQDRAEEFHRLVAGLDLPKGPLDAQRGP